MKPFAIFFLSIALITGCSSPSTQKTAYTSLVESDSLLGDWMITNVEVSGNNQLKNELMQSIVEPLKNTIELTALRFQINDLLQVDDGNVTISNGNWMLLANTLKIGHAFGETRDVPFTIKKFQHDSLVMENVFEDRKDKLRVSYTMKRMYVPDSSINIFDMVQNTWRVKPTQPETEPAMRLRLKQMLAYYSAYFATLSNNHIPIFNREKIFCPLLYFDGNLEIRPFEKDDNWVELFYDIADAQKAHKLLEKAFSGYTFPDLGNKFVQEYITGLKELSEKF
jgi:hypothetical protein